MKGSFHIPKRFYALILSLLLLLGAVQGISVLAEDKNSHLAATESHDPSIPASGGSVNVNETTYFSFIPGKTGLWTFQTSGKGDGDPYLWLYDANGYLIIENDDGAGDLDAFISIYLIEGTQYTVQAGFYGDGCGSYTLWVAEAPLTMLPGTGGSVIVYEQAYFSFIPDSTGIWTIDAVKYEYCDPLLWLYDAYGQLIAVNGYEAYGYFEPVSIRLDQGEQYIIRAGFNNAGFGSYTVQITGIPLAILPGTGGSAQVNRLTYYSITPDSTGIWTFRTSGNGYSDPYLSLYDAYGQYITGDDDGAGGLNALITAYMAEGEQYLILAGYYGADSGNYTLEAARMPISALPAVNGSVTVEGGSYFSFMPERTGLWSFQTFENGDSDPYLRLYDAYGQLIAEDDDGAEGLNAFISAYLAEGMQYVISAGFFGYGAGSYTLRATEETMPAIADSGGILYVDRQAYYSFTPGSSGLWAFTTSNNKNCDPYLCLYDGNGLLICEDDDGAGELNAFILWYLEEGAQYVVRAGFLGNDSGSYVLQVINEN